jgi:hypothetical protein
MDLNLIVTVVSFTTGIFIVDGVATLLDNWFHFTERRDRKGRYVPVNTAISFYIINIIGIGIVGVLIDRSLSQYLLSSFRYLSTFFFTFVTLAYLYVLTKFTKKIRKVDILVVISTSLLAVLGYYYGNEISFGGAFIVILFGLYLHYR